MPVTVTVIAGLGLYIWVPGGPVSPSFPSQAAVLGWVSRVLSSPVQAGAHEVAAYAGLLLVPVAPLWIQLWVSSGMELPSR